MKREELIAYDKWLTRRKWGTGEIISPEKAADLYLAEHPLPPAGGAEEILAKGKVLMFGHVIVDPIMLPEGIYATKELRIYLPETTIEHLLETGKSFRDKTQTRWLPDSYFDNLSKCELIDVDVVRDATLHAQKIADKMVEEMLREELMTYDKFLSNTYWGISHITKREEAVDEYLKSRER